MREDILDTTLTKAIQDSSEIKISRDLYEDDSSLKTLLADVHIQIYSFSIEVSYYYLSPRWKRFLKGIFVPEQKLTDAADRLDNTMISIRNRCSILSQERQKDMQTENSSNHHSLVVRMKSVEESFEGK
jgi:deoxyadenosine/deoxycytidine kinase